MRKIDVMERFDVVQKQPLNNNNNKALFKSNFAIFQSQYQEIVGQTLILYIFFFLGFLVFFGFSECFVFFCLKIFFLPVFPCSPLWGRTMGESHLVCMTTNVGECFTPTLLLFNLTFLFIFNLTFLLLLFNLTFYIHI